MSALGHAPRAVRNDLSRGAAGSAGRCQRDSDVVGDCPSCTSDVGRLRNRSTDYQHVSAFVDGEFRCSNAHLVVAGPAVEADPRNNGGQQRRPPFGCSDFVGRTHDPAAARLDRSRNPRVEHGGSGERVRGQDRDSQHSRIEWRLHQIVARGGRCSFGSAIGEPAHGGREHCRSTGRVRGEVTHAQQPRAARGAFDGGGDVVQLQVEKDSKTLFNKRTDGFRADRREQLEADLRDSKPGLDRRGQSLRADEVVAVERDGEVLSGDVAR